MRPEPTRIEPIFSPRIWGARSLDPLFPEKTNLKEPIGEAWLTGVDCRIASGPYAGKTLGEAWHEMPAEWRGTRFDSTAQFPLLVKFIFPTDKLSIQVHPDDAYAAAHEQAAGGRGKTEMWHAISAEPGARVLVGLKPGVTRERFQDSLAAQTTENLLREYAVRAGDTFFVSAGTPHTIGSGMVLCEVQEYSDLTYRVYDYGRVDAQGKSRQLHIEKALEVIQFENARDSRVKHQPLPSHDALKFLLAACSHFATERWEFAWTFETQTDPTHFDLLVILSGSGSIGWQGRERPYGRGQCWLIPATLGKFELKPEENTSLIRTCLPDLAALHQELRREGIAEAKLTTVLFD
jgi:mannose-6-phosphate isomerase